VAWCQRGDELNQDIFDALTEFFAQVLDRGERLAAEFGVPSFCLKAIHRLDESVTLKELGRRMHCDPSFVTVIADTLEERGLARREPDAADRRIKNLVLTPGGLELKGRLEAALLGQMPWAHALDVAEQESFLSMIRRMNGVLTGTAAVPGSGEGPGGAAGTGTQGRAQEVSDTPITASGPAGPRSSAGLRSEAGPAAELTGTPA
jgi:DNA-binding MarR family transcriptional regulator